MTSSQPLNSIAILTLGSRGDVQPYVALAKGLQGAGYDVCICTGKDSKEFIEEFGIKFQGVFPPIDAVLKESKYLRTSMEKGDTIAFLQGFNTQVDKAKDATAMNLKKAFDDFKFDLCIEGQLSEYFGALVKYKLKIPVLRVKLSSQFYERDRMFLGFPTLPFGLHKLVLTNIFLGAMYEGFKPQDRSITREFGVGVLDVYSKQKHLTEHCVPPGPDLPCYVLQSAIWLDVTNPSRPPMFNAAGACIIEADAQQQFKGKFGDTALLEQFIAAGSKPVYCGWGSMTCKSSKYMVLLIVKALMHCGQRAIVLGGWANLGTASLHEATQDPDILAYAERNILFVDSAPHEWLFPRVSCVVHHGGAGTLNASARSGVPTIITPVWLDQWDNVYLVNQLGIGVGMSKQFHKISAKELGNTIKEVLESESIKAKARDIGEKLRAEDGVKNMVQNIQAFWKDWVQTGEYGLTVTNYLSAAAEPVQCCSCASGIARFKK